MAGMRPFVLYEENASAYCLSLMAAGCPSSQIAIVHRQLFPSGRWLSAPAPTNCKPDPRGSGFLSRDGALDPHAAVFFCADAQCGLARARKPIYVIGV